MSGAGWAAAESDLAANSEAPDSRTGKERTGKERRKKKGPVGPLDRISLTGLRVFGRHGVLRREREQGQEFVVDAVLWLDTRAAAAADDLACTVDYDALASKLADVVADEPVSLIETLAERLAAACLAGDRVRVAEVTVHKPNAPVGLPVDDISVTIRRSRT